MIRADGAIRPYYQGLRQRGKPGKVALVAVMRKLLLPGPDAWRTGAGAASKLCGGLPISEQRDTYIVDLPRGHWADLELWVAAHGGQARPLDLALGDHGWAYASTVPDFFTLAQEDLERDFPGQRLLDPATLSLEQRLEVYRAYADCACCSDGSPMDDYDWEVITPVLEDLLVPVPDAQS